MRLVIMRHGKTASNMRGACTGRTDDALCEAGVEQARAMGKFAQLDCVYVSPLLRARQTASICFPSARHVVHEDLKEMDFGDFEGKTHEENAEDPRYLQWLDSWCESPCPNGESKEGFIGRTYRAVMDCLADAVIRAEHAVVVVAHGGTVMSCMDALRADPSKTYFDWRVENCEAYGVELCMSHEVKKLLGATGHQLCRLDDESASDCTIADGFAGDTAQRMSYAGSALSAHFDGRGVGVRSYVKLRTVEEIAEFCASEEEGAHENHL